MPKRIKTDYPGVFYREVKRVGKKGTDKVYYVVYKKDGKTVEAKAGSQRRNEMTPAKANTYRANLIEGKALTPVEKRKAEKAAREAEAEKWTIAKLWGSYCEANPDNKNLKAEMRRFDVNLKDTIGKKAPCDLVPLDVNRIRLKLQKTKGKTTAARILELLRRTLNYGVKQGLIPPLSFKIEVPRLNNVKTEDLTESQLKNLLKVLDKDEDQQVANVMRLALFTGMRRSEIFKLEWRDIDKGRGFIALRDPKGGTDQKIPLNEAARAIIEGIEPKEENPYIFPGQKKKSHLTTLHRVSVDRIRKAAGLPKGFRPLHGLRHVYASMLASSGQVDLYTLQKLLTHKSPAMTQRYAHLRDEALKKAANVASDIVLNLGTKKERKNA